MLEEAISRRKPITFNYIKEDKGLGKRIGNPHALYYRDASKEVEDIKVDVYQTGGASDSVIDGKDSLPNWRPFLIKYIQNIEIKDDMPDFSVAPGYNSSSSPRYDYYIERYSLTDFSLGMVVV